MNLEARSLARVTVELKVDADARGPAPFERLFHGHYSRVVAIAYQVLADRHEAEDVAQEVFLSFHARHSPDASYAPAWLHAAAAHTALNVLRGKRRRERREATQAQTQDAAVRDPEQIVERAERRREVRAALGRLPARKAAVLALRYSGLSYAEVAAALGVGVGQVGTLLRRAEEALRKEVTRETPR